MNHRERGCFLIFNQTVKKSYIKQRCNLHFKTVSVFFCLKEFDHLPERKFAKDSYLKMKKVAERLGFEHIRIFHEKTKEEILQVLRACELLSFEYVNYIQRWARYNLKVPRYNCTRYCPPLTILPDTVKIKTLLCMIL